MKKSIAACVGMLLAAGSACSAEYAFTVRPTELKAKPFADAASLARLPDSSRVDVLARQASWLQVKANAATGWVKLLSVRFEQLAAPSKGAPPSTWNVLFNIAQTGSAGAVPTTGVKGISEEALTNPRPDPAALQKMHELDAKAAETDAFARAGQLSVTAMAYLAAPGAKP